MVTIIGAGLAGCEAAWQCAKRGVPLTLCEQRPATMTEAHQTADFAELVCSNSLKSLEPTNAHGLLKAELELLDCLLLRIARNCAVPGGKALVVDRTRFARQVTEEIARLPGITVRRESVASVPETGITIIATGPLTSPELTRSLTALLGTDSLAFYDAISPIVSADSIDRSRCFAASRWGHGSRGGIPLSDDYLNCPLTEAEYDTFYQALTSAELFPLHDFEQGVRGHDPEFARDSQANSGHVPAPQSPSGESAKARYFEACLPVEELARRGHGVLLFGPMKPVGLTDPATGRRPFAVVQLRRENAEGTMYNLVGFQTRMKQAEQRRVLGLIPALAHAEYLRYGSVHRNTFINAPDCLLPTLQTRKRDALLIAGQLSGVEGYVESIGTGLWAGINAARLAQGLKLLVPPPETILGGLVNYITRARGHDPEFARDSQASSGHVPAAFRKGFQPMNANFGLLTPPTMKRSERPRAYCDRSLAALRQLTGELGISGLSPAS